MTDKHAPEKGYKFLFAHTSLAGITHRLQSLADDFNTEEKHWERDLLLEAVNRLKTYDNRETEMGGGA